MRKLIADHMVRSVQTSPHVTSFVEADVTRIVDWRNKNKDSLPGEDRTEAHVHAIFHRSSGQGATGLSRSQRQHVDGDRIVLKKGHTHIGSGGGHAGGQPDRSRDPQCGPLQPERPGYRGE